MKSKPSKRIKDAKAKLKEIQFLVCPSIPRSDRELTQIRFKIDRLCDEALRSLSGFKSDPTP